MEDYQTELLTIYAELSYVLVSRIAFAVNEMSEKYARIELETFRKIKEELVLSILYLP